MGTNDVHAPMTTGFDVPALGDFLAYKCDEKCLAGRVILVTGAAGGIGRAVAAAYARHGARLVLLDWNKSALEGAHEAFIDEGWPEPLLCPVDLSRITLGHIRELAGEIDCRFGALDGLLNNAAWAGELTPFEHCQPKTWSRVMNINLAAPFFLTQWLMPLLRKSEDPVVVFSLHACAKAYWNGFAMAKAAQEALLKVLADEYAPDTSHPVRIIGIDPGPVMTTGRRQLYPGEKPDAHPLPDELTGPYLFAMGPDAKDFSGQIIRDAPPNGGASRVTR